MHQVFTVCSNNYLAEASVLGDSLLKYATCPVHFTIFLADKFNTEIEYSSFLHPVIELHDSIVPGFSEVIEKYDIIELNTAVKPDIFKYLQFKYPDAQTYCFFDPDIMVFGDYQGIVDELSDHNILLTPHISRPVPEETEPFENLFLNYGVYNLGFIALRRSEEVVKFLDWWGRRTMSMGYRQHENGIYVDQLWINLAPVFFEKVKVSRHLGLNVAYWNLFERTVTKSPTGYLINNIHRLIFFHFSSFDLSLKKITRRPFDRFLESDKAVMELAHIYKNELLSHGHDRFKKISAAYKLSPGLYLKREIGSLSTSMKLALRLHAIMPKWLSDRVIVLGNAFSKARILRHLDRM